MKNLKKLASLLLVLVMVFAMAVTVSADPTANLLSTEQVLVGDITIVDNGTTGATVNGRRFGIAKILDATQFGEDSIAYTVPENMKEFYKTALNITEEELNAKTLDVLVTERINAMTDLELYDFSLVVYAWVMENKDAVEIIYRTGENGKVEFKDMPIGYYAVVDVSVIPNNNITTLSAIILVTAGEKESIQVKTYEPPIDKKIDGNADTDPATEGLVSYNNTSIGDTVPFVVTSKIPNLTPFNEYIFKFTDTLSEGLTYSEKLKDAAGNTYDNLTVTIGDLTLTEGIHYTETVTVDETTGETTLVVNMLNFAEWHRGHIQHETGTWYKLTDGTFTQTPPDNARAADYVQPAVTYLDTANDVILLDKEIKLTYSAVVNTDAVVGIEGNPNGVTLEYTRDPKNYQLTTTTVEKITRTFVTGIEITKVDKDGHLLTGAEFQLTGIRTNIVLVSGQEYLPSATGTWYMLKDGHYTDTAPDPEADTSDIYSDVKWYRLDGAEEEYTDVAPTAETAYKYANGVDTVGISTYRLAPYENRPVQTTTAVNASAFVDANGKLVFKGLGAGDYVITELTSPAGYNMLRYPITVNIAFAPPANATANGKWSGTFRLTPNEAEVPTEMTVNGETGMLSFSVVNEAGTLLPSTGGIGTTIFYILGGILVLGAAVLLITKKKVGAN